MNNRIFDLDRLDHDVMVPQFTDHNDSLDPPGCYEIPFGEPGRIPQRSPRSASDESMISG